MLDGIQASQATKVAILFATCFVIGLIFFNSGGGDNNLKEVPSKEAHQLFSSEPASENSEETHTRMMAGGLGAVREKDDTVVEVVEKVKPMLEERTGKKFASLEVLHYKTQVVAGTNYFVKVEAKTDDGKESIIHLRIYKDLQKNIELTAFQLDQSREGELRHFEP